MKQLFAALLMALTFNSQAMAQQRTVKLRVVQTDRKSRRVMFMELSFHTTSSTASPKREPWRAYPLTSTICARPTRTTSSSWRTATSCRVSLPATIIIM